MRMRDERGAGVAGTAAFAGIWRESNSFQGRFKKERSAAIRAESDVFAVFPTSTNVVSGYAKTGYVRGRRSHPDSFVAI